MKSMPAFAIASARTQARGSSIMVPILYGMDLSGSWYSDRTSVMVSFIIGVMNSISLLVDTSGIIISICGEAEPSFTTSQAADIAAVTCILVISGYTTESRHPRKPIIGLTSSNSSHRFLMTSSSPIISHVSSSLGKNSCRGGSSKRIVTGKPLIATKMAFISSFWYTERSFSNISRFSWVSANTIFLMVLILSISLKNICSVLQSPIPSAPSKRAV
mmetsp:Transcript_32909/g.47643  ORF Transcript_32909/g.47643 Transcript_32909/m.47643 type:complete len:217 (-) Transcript_32909:1946-2596(-)